MVRCGCQVHECVRDAVCKIIGSPLSGAAYDQACISTKVGGLGIRRVVDHAIGAFSASWHESGRTCGESWTAPDLCADDYVPQSVFSADVDRKTLERLIVESNERDAQRLRRVDMPHANVWISARPSVLDGKDCVMKPRVYLTCVRRLLGLPVMSAPAPCPLCMQTMDVYGDHAICCKKSGDLITRHNRVRNLVSHFGDLGMLDPQMEKLGILGPTDRSRRRPGDVSFKIWGSGYRGLAIDVAVICPLAASHLREEEPCESYAVRHKHARYDESFKDSDYDFVAMVFETSGAVNTEGLEILKQIFLCASKRTCQPHSAFCARAWTRLSCCVQISVAQMILNREIDDSMQHVAAVD